MTDKLRKKEAKKLFKKPAGKLERIDLSSKSNVPQWMTRAYSNNRYVVMIDDAAKMTRGVTATKAMIQRHDNKPIPNHWKEIQAIKNEIFGVDATGAEFYPAVSELVDDFNIYWLWILPAYSLPLYLPNSQPDLRPENASSNQRFERSH